MKNFLINVNGLLASGDEAKISVFDRGFLYGDSVYEATRTFNRRPFRIDRHIDRLFQSAEKISLTPTHSKEKILEEIQKTIDHSPHDNVAIRIVLTRGTNSELGLDPDLSAENNLIISTSPIPPNPTSWLSEGVEMIFYQKYNPASGALPKTGNYQENILAHNQAKKSNAYDAFMINTNGFVTEGTTSNAWIIKNQTLYTPPLSDGVLDGLTRKTIIELAGKGLLPLPLIEKSLTKDDFFKADECFITSTTRNILPVTKLEGQPVGAGKPGRFSAQILKIYLDFMK